MRQPMTFEREQRAPTVLAPAGRFVVANQYERPPPELQRPESPRASLNARSGAAPNSAELSSQICSPRGRQGGVRNLT
jgi:hypothetical protein